MKIPGLIALAVLAAGALQCARAPQAGSASPDVTFTAANEMNFPASYREWIYVSSGMGMTYRNPEEAPAGEPTFDNVFVSPGAYREFKRTGLWPDPAYFVVEVRSSRSHGSIARGGRFQGEIRSVEVEAKDRSRFSGGWAFFGFEPGEGTPPPSRALPRSAPCYECHSEHGAVEQTFVQFYPTLLAVATRLHTLNPGFEPGSAGEGAPEP